jgi:flagellar biogenesis protein FliO
VAEELSWVRWVTALFVVAIAMAVSFIALRRVQSSHKSWLPIRITGRVRLNRSAELMLVEVENERFLIGATPANISTIAKLSGKTGADSSRADSEPDSALQNIPT